MTNDESCLNARIMQMPYDPIYKHMHEMRKLWSYARSKTWMPMAISQMNY